MCSGCPSSALDYDCSCAAPGKSRVIVVNARNALLAFSSGPHWWQLFPRWLDHQMILNLLDGDLALLHFQVNSLSLSLSLQVPHILSTSWHNFHSFLCCWDCPCDCFLAVDEHGAPTLNPKPRALQRPLKLKLLQKAYSHLCMYLAASGAKYDTGNWWESWQMEQSHFHSHSSWSLCCWLPAVAQSVWW